MLNVEFNYNKAANKNKIDFSNNIYVLIFIYIYMLNLAELLKYNKYYCCWLYIFELVNIL